MLCIECDKEFVLPTWKRTQSCKALVNGMEMRLWHACYSNAETISSLMRNRLIVRLDEFLSFLVVVVLVVVFVCVKSIGQKNESCML